MNTVVKPDKKYPLKVWLTSLIVTPVLIIVERCIRGKCGDLGAIPMAYLIMIGYGALISLPVLLI